MKKIPPSAFNTKQITVMVLTELYKSFGLVKSCGKIKPTINSVIPTVNKIRDIMYITF